MASPDRANDASRPCPRQAGVLPSDGTQAGAVGLCLPGGRRLYTRSDRMKVGLLVRIEAKPEYG